MRRAGARRCTFVMANGKRCENSVKSGYADRCYIASHHHPVQQKLFVKGGVHADRLEVHCQGNGAYDRFDDHGDDAIGIR